MTTSPLLPQIQNVVSTVSILPTENNNKFDLYSLAAKLANAEYRPERFSALVIRGNTPSLTALFFSTGRLVCVGTKSTEESFDGIGRFMALIDEAIESGIRLKEAFKVRNMTASCPLGRRLSLEGLYVFLHSRSKPSWIHHCSFNPELFPGMCIRMTATKCVALLFSSGKCVITGALNEREIHETFQKLYQILKKFLK